EKRRLARSGEPDEDDELATLDVERDPVDRAGAARIDLPEAPDLEPRPHAGSLWKEEGRRSLRRPSRLRERNGYGDFDGAAVGAGVGVALAMACTSTACSAAA